MSIHSTGKGIEAKRTSVRKCAMQLPKLLELVGLGYSAWFVYRYLLFKVTAMLLLPSKKSQCPGASLLVGIHDILWVASQMFAVIFLNTTSFARRICK